jgi:hypothetical protein
LPILVGILVSHGVARYFNRSLYDYALRSKQMPVLKGKVPKANRDLMVRDMIQSLYPGGYELEVVESVSSVERLS